MAQSQLQHTTAPGSGRCCPAPAAHTAANWGSLRLELLELIFDQLCQLQPLLSVPQVARLRASLAVNRQWWQAARQLRLPAVRCSLFDGELPCLLALADRGVTVEQLWLQNGGGEVARQAFEHIGSEENQMACWCQLTSGARLLAGLPACLIPSAGMHSCSSRLRALHLQLSASMKGPTIGGDSWQLLTALHELQICGEPRAELIMDRLPPSLWTLSVSARAVAITLPVLLAVPAASLAAEEVYLVGSIEEGQEDGLDAPPCKLHTLLEAVAAAGMPRGHAFHLGVQAVWYRRVCGQAAWLVADDPNFGPLVDERVVPHHVNHLYHPPPVARVRVKQNNRTSCPYRYVRPPLAPEDAALHPLLPQPPAEVQAEFTAKRGVQNWFRTAQYSNLTAFQLRWRPTWSLDPNDQVTWSQPAMLITVDSVKPWELEEGNRL